MNPEIKQNLKNLIIIKQKIFAAFADVQLGDGIGMFEADAIDDYFSPDTSHYIEAKAKDERFDIKKLYKTVKGFKKMSNQLHNFMDAKGLHFYLPILLLFYEQDYKEQFLRDLIAQEKPKYIELMTLLTLEQKMAIISSIENDIDYDSWVEFYINFKGQECRKCGQIHEPENYSLEQAKARVESTDEYILLQYLKENLEP